VKKVKENKSSNKVLFIEMEQGLRTIAPPFPAQANKPLWVNEIAPTLAKGLPAHQLTIKDKTNKTIRTCPGIRDLYESGFIIPAWSDMLFRYDSYSGELNVEFSSNKFSYHLHSREQVEGMFLEKFVTPYKGIINLHSPWRIKLPGGFSTLLVHPFWHRSEREFSIIPGIVDHDKFHTFNIILKWNLLGSGEYIIERGTPLAQIIPYRRESLIINFEDYQSPENLSNKKLEDQKMAEFFKKYKKLFFSKK
jgi:hypothetical protein